MTRASVWIARAAVAAAAVLLVVRLPTTISDLSSTRRANDARDAQSRLLASADSLDIDNAFVIAAMDYLPAHATFAVVRPHAVGKRIRSTVTYGALPGYFQSILLPRRETSGRKADYILCYACLRKDLPIPVTWIWSKGYLSIGKARSG